MGSFFIMYKILRNIMASAAEAEYGALFLNGQAAVPIRTTLIEMNRPQPPTPIQVENSTQVGIANKSIKQKLSKAMDMRFHWIQDRILQEHFNTPKITPLFITSKWDILTFMNHMVHTTHCKGVLIPQTIKQQVQAQASSQA